MILSRTEWMWLSPIDWMRASLPLPVNGATLGTFYLNVRGCEPNWYLTVMCPWRIMVNGREICSEADEGVTDDDKVLAWLVGRALVDLTSADSDGAEPVFDFSGGVRLEVMPNQEPESYVFGVCQTAHSYTCN